MGHYDVDQENKTPLKPRKFKYRSTLSIDQSLREFMFKRDQIHKIARQTGVQSNWNQYRIMRDDVKRKLRESERKYVNKELEKNRSSNAMWKVIRKIENAFRVRRRLNPYTQIIGSYSSRNSTNFSHLSVNVLLTCLRSNLPQIFPPQTLLSMNLMSLILKLLLPRRNC